MFGIKAAVGDGVRNGLSKAFGPGGAVYTAFDQALNKGLEPIRQELTRLRKIEWCHRWHPIEKLPAWAKDGRPMLLSERGEMFWASYVAEAGEEPYWDRDLEYGGSCCDPTDFFLLPEPPLPAKSSPSAAREANADTGHRDSSISRSGTNQ